MKRFFFHDERDWFLNRRLGLFIHWGLYALDGIHEQVQQRFDIPAQEYQKRIGEFNPRFFDPRQWTRLARENGFEYMVFTAKHHDGFCLWHSRETLFQVGNSPYRADIARQLADACREAELPLEFYYSVVDWHQENYPNIGRHHEIVTDPAKHDWRAYLEFLKRQVTELCANYGKIHGIWWDMNVPEGKAPEIHELIRRRQPGAVINNRGFDTGDYSTPERDIDPEGANRDGSAARRLVEACQSVGINSWGFRRDEDYYSIRYFLQRIDETLAAGGNYLLNVGPDADGVIPPPAEAILRGVGSWFRRVREAFDAESVPNAIEDRRYPVTRDGNCLYIHCPTGIPASTVNLRPITAAPRHVTLLNTGQPVDWTLEPIIFERHRGPALRLRNLPVDELNDTVPVIRLEFESEML